MNRLFHAYGRHRGEIAGRRNGVLISNDQGEAVAYALWNLEDRGPMMIEPGWKVYRGMIVGEHTRGNDLEVNVLKGKKLTNIRTHSKDEAVRLTPPIRMTLEKALAYIERRRAGRGDAEVDPAAQEAARPQRAQAARSGARKPQAGVTQIDSLSHADTAIASSGPTANDFHPAICRASSKRCANAAQNFAASRVAAATSRQTRDQVHSIFRGISDNMPDAVADKFDALTRHR